MKSFLSQLPALSFLSPDHLWYLLILPVVVLAYLWALRGRKKNAVRYGNFGMLKQAVGTSGRFRRHIPPLLFLFALALMILGVARPSAVLTLSSQRSTVMLVLDVSGSMRATDIKPSRLEAMEQAAKAFVEQQPKDVNIGVVAFASSAFLVQPPTTDHTNIDTAIDHLKLHAGRLSALVS